MISEELRKKVLKAFEGDYIGDTTFHDEEIEEISKFVKSTFNPITGVDVSSYLFYTCLVILIAQKSHNYGDDIDSDSEESHYYVELFGDILNDETITPYCSKIRLDEFFANHGKTWLRDQKGRTRRFKQTLLYNSFAPRYSLEAFTQMIFDSYTSKEIITTGFFDDSYELDNRPYIRFVDAYAKKLQGIKDIDQEVSLYDKMYHLSAAMRHGFTQDKERVAKLVSRTVTYIRKYFLKEPIYDDTYFSKLVSDYLTKEKVKENVYFGGTKIEKVRSISDWYAYYSLNVNEGINAPLLIKMPLLKLDSLDQYSNIRLYLSLDNRVIENIPVNIVGYDYNPHINPITIDVTKHLRQSTSAFSFKVEVYASESKDPIFSTDCKSSLIRPFLIFSEVSERENKEEIINPTLYHSIQVIIPTGLTQQFLNSNTFEEATRIKDNVYHLSPKMNEYLSFGDKTVYFIDALKESTYAINGQLSNKLSFESSSGSKYEVYRNVKSIKITPSKEYYGGTDEFKIRITNISNAHTKKTKNYSFLLNNNIRRDGIILNSSCYDFINKYGVNIVDIVRCSDEKVLTKVSYFCGNYKANFHEESITENGALNLNLFLNDDKVLSGEYIVQDKNAYFQLDFGTLVITLPYICFELKGCNNSSRVYLTNQTKCQNIYAPREGQGDVLSLPASKITIKNTTDYTVTILCDDEKIEANNGEYLVGEYLKKCIDKSSVIKLLLKDKNGRKKEYKIYQLFSQEYVDPKGLSIVFDDNTFYYQINGFIGDINPAFRIDIYNKEESTEENPLTTEPIFLEGLSGSFKIKNFQEGYYNAILRRAVYEFVEYKAKGVLIRRESDNYAFAFGDPNKTMYSNSVFRLEKITDLCKPKEMKEYSIKNIKFLKYGIYPVFEADLVLGGRRNRLPIFVVFKNVQNAVLYSNYDDDKKLFMNRITKEIVVDPAPDCISIRSVYIHEEE